MLFGLRRKSRALEQEDSASWRARWQSLVPPECRDVQITADGRTFPAFICMNQ